MNEKIPELTFLPTTWRGNQIKHAPDGTYVSLTEGKVWSIDRNRGYSRITDVRTEQSFGHVSDTICLWEYGTFEIYGPLPLPSVKIDFQSETLTYSRDGDFGQTSTDSVSIRNKVLMWLGQWRGNIDPKAVSALQDICEVSES